MSLADHSTRPLSDDQSWIELVRAISAAKEVDETLWLEWKSHLDLAAKVDQFALAKEILAMANRDVRAASVYCEGWAYIVVGASEEGIGGIEPQASASLEQKLSRYLGTGKEAPRWHLHNVTVDDRNVLIIEVEPPKDGDRMYTLHRDSPTGARAGTVFTRIAEKSEQASPAQIVMLEDRLVDGGFEERIMERVALVCTTLDAHVDFDESNAAQRLFAVITDQPAISVAPSVSVWLHPVPRLRFSASIPGGPSTLWPPRTTHMLAVYPAGYDLRTAYSDVRDTMKALNRPYAISDHNTPEPGNLIAVCTESFGELHSAIKLLLRAGPAGSIGMHSSIQAIRIQTCPDTFDYKVSI